MRYRRALLLVELEGDARPALTTLCRVAPELEQLVVVARLPAPAFAWLSGEDSREPEEEAPAAVESLRALATRAAPSCRVQLVPEFGVDALAALCAAERTELLVVGERSLRSLAAMSQVRRQHGLAVLFADAPTRPGPLREVACFAPGRRGRSALGTFLRDHADPSLHVTLLHTPELPPQEVAALLEVAGIQARVEAGDFDSPVDLLVVTHASASLLAGVSGPAPVLLLPSVAREWRFGARALDIADLHEEAGVLRTRVGHLVPVGDLPSLPDQALAFVSGGRVVATVTSQQGEVVLPAGLDARVLGVYRVGEGSEEDPLAAVEQRVSVLRPGAQPLIVFDAELSEALLRSLAELSGPPVPELLAVRLRPTRSCESIRERLREVGLPPHVLDARAVLEEGEALDVSEAVDPVRLARVASRLRRAGFPVTAIVHRGQVAPLVQGFAALSEPALTASGGSPAVQAAAGAPLPEALAPGASVAGNRIELELDNARARGWLLEAIRTSQETVHLQTYIVQDDAVAREVEEALAQAAARGVQVRMLVDSLHGLHGSFGTRNPLLERLSLRPGVQLRILRPLTELPSLADLKQRDHRKLVVVDGRVALVGGRNLSREYYTGFEEVPLSPRTTWPEVPWLDAGARVEGPLVGALQACFLEAWRGAGGEPFDVSTPPPAGPSHARLVVHHGLRDARTLEMYRELIDSATSHVYAVNGFPLLLELQHALLRALRRGVRVRVLAGPVTPTHGGEPFAGPWVAARTAATELVHSRLDPLVEAGGEVSLFGPQRLPGWHPALGVVHPHVHAKVVSADGQRCAVGSANLDITASYWESELMLLVEDAALVRGFEAQLDALLVGSVQVRREEPAWQELARRRAWMRHWPGVLSV